jgi:hypothetical protein
MYRLGPTSTSSILGEYPDIAVYGKLLSGGYMPLAATLATTEVFNAFLGKKKWHALLHGHSFTANPIGHLLLLIFFCTYPFLTGLYGNIWCRFFNTLDCKLNK